MTICSACAILPGNRRKGAIIEQTSELGRVATASPAAVAGQTVKGYLLVLAAATMWGSIGIFYTFIINDNGLSPLSAVMARGTVACAILFGGLALFRRDLLRVQKRDLPYFAAMGLITVTLVFTLYAYAITLVGVSVAAVLQYTAPAFVTVIAWRFYRESLNREKIIALILALAGVVLIAELYDTATVQLNIVGVACGLTTGLCFGLYSIFNKRAVKRYSAWTVITYNLGFGMLFLAFVQMPAAIRETAAAPGAWPYIVAMAILATVLPHGLYVSGLAHVPASTASIMATWEPAMATILAYTVLGETLDSLQMLGALAIILGVILLSRKRT